MKPQQTAAPSSDDRASPFLYDLGDHVHWATGGQAWQFRWQVLQQRLTVSLVSHWREYLLVSVDDPYQPTVWAAEADLTAWEAPPSPPEGTGYGP